MLPNFRVFLQGARGLNLTNFGTLARSFCSLPLEQMMTTKSFMSYAFYQEIFYTCSDEFSGKNEEHFQVMSKAVY